MSDADLITQLVLIRHGEACGDPHVHVEPPVEGFLTEWGLQQARALSRSAKGVRFDHVYASPLGRAIQTAQALVHDPKQIELMPWLIEWRPASVMGEGPSDDASYASMMQAAAKIRPEMAWKTPAGEGTLEMAHRIIPPLLALLQHHGITAQHGGFAIDPERREGSTLRLAMVAHGGSLAMMTGFLMGLPIRPHGPFRYMNTGLAVIEFVQRVDVWYPTLRLPAAGETLDVINKQP